VWSREGGNASCRKFFFLGGGTQKTYVDEWLLSVSLRLCGWAGPVPAALVHVNSLI
jgi:hypothetical protein